MRVLYQDEVLLVVDKPSGLVVHRGWGRDAETVIDLVRRLPGGDAARLVHRLDRGTSGVLALACTTDAARSLHEQFEEHATEKRYIALVRGVAPESGVVDHAIPRRRDGPRVPAVTQYRRLATAETEPRHLSLVEARPRTGRLHQVRRHLKHENHPVIGDANYGRGPLNRALRERYGLARLALHACSLSLVHPLTGETHLFEAALPPDFAEPLRAMGFPEEVLDGVARTGGRTQ